MKRLVIITVGKTHSGKTTFAKALEKRMHNSVVIDQDSQAEFLHTYYQELLPKQGPNKIKYALTKTIADYAVDETNCHVILCNSNRYHKERLELLGYYHDKGFVTVLVNFDIPDSILEERVLKSQRNTTILRTVSSFGEVLTQQQSETCKENFTVPAKNEADHLFTIQNAWEIEKVIQEIIEIAKI